VFNLNSLVFVPLLGLGTAVTVLTGHRIGEGRPHLAKRTTWWAAGLACFYVISFGGIYLFAPELILRPYGLQDHPALHDLVVFLLRFVAAYSLFDALAVVFSSTIRGAGDTTFAMVFSFFSGVVLLVLPTYYAAQRGPEGFKLAWYAVTLFMVWLAIGFMLRFQQGRWMSMRVIEHTAPELAELGELEDADEPVAARTSG